MENDDMIFEALGLTEESRLVCKYIAESLRLDSARDALREMLNENLEIIGMSYAGYDGLPGRRVEYDDLLDVYNEQYIGMLKILRRYSSFY